MKCPECNEELEKNPHDIPFTKDCKKCKIIWVIQTIEQSYAMGVLNTELYSRNDLSTSEKIEIMLKKAKELDFND